MVTLGPDPDVWDVAVVGLNVLTAAGVRMFQLSSGTGRQSVRYILFISTDVSLVSSFVSSGSKVLLDLTDREKYAAYFQRFEEVTCASVHVCFVLLVYLCAEATLLYTKPPRRSFMLCVDCWWRPERR